MKAKTKDAKEIILARISTKQAILVAIISLVSAVAVAGIANLDKLRSTQNALSEEVGYYEGKASSVKRAFQRTEEELQTEGELAVQMGDLKKATRLKDLRNQVQKNYEKFQELHDKHLEAIRNDKRLVASEIKTDANETISETNTELARARAMIATTLVAKLIESNREPLIPLYGKHGIVLSQEQVCKLIEDQPATVANESE